MIYIYKITNLKNNKIYIGQTNNVSRRWSQYKHASNLKEKDQLITKAMAKHGFSNFKIEIIDKVNTREEANIKEEEYMQMYDSRNLEKGYNIATGGGVFGISEDTKKKISEGLLKFYENNPSHMLGRKYTEEHRMAISRGSMGKPGTNTGKKFSEEHKRKIAIANMYQVCSEEKRKKLSEAKKGSKPWNRRMTDEMIKEIRSRESTVEELSNKYGFSKTTIADVLYNKIYIDDNYIPPKKKVHRKLKEEEVLEILNNNDIDYLKDKYNISLKKINKIKNKKLYNRIVSKEEVYDMYFCKKMNKLSIAKTLKCDVQKIRKIISLCSREK